MDVAGKVAVVTGAGGDGSGRAIARRLAREGATLIVADVNDAGSAETVRLIDADGGRAASVHTDVRLEAEVQALIARVEDDFGGLDILVNNASGRQYPERLLDHWFTNLQVDLLGAMYGIRHGLESMRRRGGGAIVNIGSVSALCHGGRISKAPGYDTAKAAVVRLTTALTALGDDEGIRVNCLVPGWIATPPIKAYWESLTPEERAAQGVPPVLLRVEEIADAVVRLVTDDRLAGRVLVWWSGQAPGLIPVGDPGYGGLEELLIY
jgi:NAD(P)-dependent dehydrogenase (short-subunit alcohol dehydrogenase family)